MTEVDSVSDQDKLIQVVFKAKHSEARKAAFNKLTNQAFSSQITSEENVDPVPASTANNLIDQPLWTKLVLNAKDWEIRKIALNAINDQSLLENIAINDESSEVREAAVEIVANQTVLSNIAVNDVDADIRKAAMLKLDNQDLLANTAAQLALNDDIPMVRIAAVERLTDQTVLSNVAVNDELSSIRRAAILKLNDKDLLAKIAVEDTEEHVREVALICSDLTFKPGIFDNYLNKYPALKSKLQSWEEQASIDIKIQVKHIRTSDDPVEKAEAAIVLARYEQEEAKGAILALMNTLYDHRPLGWVQNMPGSRPGSRNPMFPNAAVVPSTDPGNEAAKALGAIGKSAVEPLIAVLNDTDDEAREKAIEVLGLIGGGRAVEPLIEAMTSYSKASRTEYLYICAIKALGKIKDMRAIETLEKAVNANSETVRSAAITAINNIRDHADK